MLLVLNPEGTRALRAAVPEAVTVFLLPPSAEALAGRLRGRGSETEPQLALRLAAARRELAHFPDYEYLVVNRSVLQACRELEAIVAATRARQERRRAEAQGILDSFALAPDPREGRRPGNSQE